MKETTAILKRIIISLLALVLIISHVCVPADVEAATEDPVFVSLASIDYTSLAIDEDGQIWAWGLHGNVHGQYGDGTTESSELPKKVSVLSEGTQVQFVKAEPGLDHSIALDRDGNIWTTGRGEDGELGHGSTANSLTWQKINVPGRTFIDVRAGRRTSFAIDSSGFLWGWGLNTSSNPLVPTLLNVDKDGYAVTFKSIHGNAMAIIAIDTMDRMWYLYDYEFAPRIYWMVETTGFQSVSVGTGRIEGKPFVLALDKQGYVWGWGDNTDNRIGHGLPAQVLFDPIPVSLKNDSGQFLKFNQIAAGDNHSLAIDVDGKMWVWGLNDSGQLGDGSTNATSFAKTYTISSFKDGILTMANFKSVAAGYERSYGLDTNGRLWYWGDDTLTPQLLDIARPSSSKEITSFSFASPAATGFVNESTQTITVTVPHGTDVTSLTPSITHTGVSITPNSGTAQNFSSPVTYTVTAEDGSTQNFEVTVNIAANTEKEITSFSFPSLGVTGTVHGAGLIIVTVPYGTDVTNLMPTITQFKLYLYGESNQRGR